jgi:hypothetical protein
MHDKYLSPALVTHLGREFDLTDQLSYTRASLEEALAVIINNWLQHDFEKLVFVLYRVDISEVKLKQILRENAGTDAGWLIARMIIERETEKIKTRETFEKNRKEGSAAADEEEKW